MSGIAWVRPRGPHSTDGNPSCPQGSIFAKEGHNWFQVSKDNDQIEFQNGSSGEYNGMQPMLVEPFKWTQIAFVRDPDANAVRFYRNGKPVGVKDSLEEESPFPIFGSDVMVGNYGFLNDPGKCEFNGDIDELEIFNVALPTSAIKSSYDKIVSECSPQMMQVPALDLRSWSVLAMSLVLTGLYLGWRRRRDANS